MKYNDSFSEIFANLKDGDCLGFFKGGLLYSLIPRATGGDCQHVGICYNVKRNDNVLSFNFSQQTFEGGKFDIVKIYKTADGYITDDPYFVKQDVIYYCELKKPLTEEGKLRGIADAEGQVDETYNFFELPLGLEVLEKILPKFVQEFIRKRSEKWKRVCSTHWYKNCIANGSLPATKDFFISPIESIKSSIFKGN